MSADRSTRTLLPPMSKLPADMTGIGEVLDPEDEPNIDHLVMEDDTPVDSIFTERQESLLVEPLYSSWAGPGEGRPFLALADVGLFYSVEKPAVVPDCM